jgi:poly(hydroxyalkanoate) depolymerase family esterase
MTSSFTTAMQAAARLTQAGDPAAATRIIQGALSLKPAAPGSWDGFAQAGRHAMAPVLTLPAPEGTESAPATDSHEAVPPFGGLPGADASGWAGRLKGLHKRAPLGDVIKHLRTLRPNLQPGIGGIPGRRQAPPVPDGASFAEHSFTAGARSLSYKLYIPSAVPVEPCSLVVMLHGCTQDPDDFAAGTKMNALAEEHGFLVVYPAQPRSANNMGCWNWFRPGDQIRDSGEPGMIAGLCRSVMAEHNVDPRRVYVAGLSAGGAMACVLADAYPELFAAVAIHSGLPTGSAQDVPSAFAVMRDGGGGQGLPVVGMRQVKRLAVPTIVFHGDADGTVHPRNGEVVFEQAAQAVAGGEAITERGRSAGGRDFTRRVISSDATPVIEHWLIHGAGHAWSGGDAAGSYVDPEGPDASREMLRFFKHHVKAS